jgi:uncharacterized SAM-binding protein YcdF (DUF218 family)
MVLGKELRHHPERGMRELRARSAAASVALRDGATRVLALEALLKGQEHSGSRLVCECLQELGVPLGRIQLAEITRSTREEALEGARCVREQGFRRLAVLTHGYHVPRVRRYFGEVLPAGRFVVCTPETFLQRAQGLERLWIEQGRLDQAALDQERLPETLFGTLGGLLAPLPGPLRWRLEVQAAALYRRVGGMD